jgi:quercetin 2,3-dioxygenase
MCPPTIWRVFPGIRIAASRRSPTCLPGTVEHGDSLGNRGAIAAGDIQWMTAGSGIIHQEMPKGDQIGRMHGFQLWANLPAALKMTAPRYQEVKTGDIPEITDDDGTPSD